MIPELQFCKVELVTQSFIKYFDVLKETIAVLNLRNPNQKL